MCEVDMDRVITESIVFQFEQGLLWQTVVTIIKKLEEIFIWKGDIPW